MATGASCYYQPAAGRGNPSSPSLGLRPSQSKVVFTSGGGGGGGGSRWWMRRRRGEGMTSRGSFSISRARARPALFSPVAMEWQECRTYSVFSESWSRRSKLMFHVQWPISVTRKEKLFLNGCHSYQLSSTHDYAYDNLQILEDKPDLSRWTLKYAILGQDVEFSWLARNMTPTKNQKIHWRSLEGLPNRGAVRFFPKSPSSCRVQLTVAYEVPEILTPVASALKPFLEGLLFNGLERFVAYAKQQYSKTLQS
ncbi:hypothetical protein ACQ4PT_014795 [Festuca glaucescens]